MLTACFFSRYEPGSLRPATGADEHHQFVTVGCLDVLLEATTDAQVPPTHPVVRYALGNRCAHAVPVDFRRVRVEGLYASGRAAMDVVDPRGEIHPALLDGHARASEALEYRPATEHLHPPASLCLVLSTLTPSELTDEAATRCFVFTHDNTPAAQDNRT